MCRHPLLSWHQHSPTAAQPPRCCHQDGPWTQDPQNHSHSILPAGTGLPTRPCGAVLCQAPPAATAPHCTRDTRGNGLRAGKEVEAASTSVLVHAASSRPTGLLLPPGTGGSPAAPTHLAHGRGAARPSWRDTGAGQSLWLDSLDSASQDGITGFSYRRTRFSKNGALQHGQSWDVRQGPLAQHSPTQPRPHGAHQGARSGRTSPRVAQGRWLWCSPHSPLAPMPAGAPRGCWGQVRIWGVKHRGRTRSQPWEAARSHRVSLCPSPSVQAGSETQTTAGPKATNRERKGPV